MPANIQELKDTQNERDERNIAIDRVGVKSLKFPVEVREKQGGSQRTVATTALAAGRKPVFAPIATRLKTFSPAPTTR